MHLFRHDLRAGVSTSGVSTAVMGKHITFFGPRREPDWRVALREILGKVEGKGCRRLAFVPWEAREGRGDPSGSEAGSFTYPCTMVQE